MINPQFLKMASDASQDTNPSDIVRAHADVLKVREKLEKEAKKSDKLKSNWEKLVQDHNVKFKNLSSFIPRQTAQAARRSPQENAWGLGLSVLGRLFGGEKAMPGIRAGVNSYITERDRMLAEAAQAQNQRNQQLDMRDLNVLKGEADIGEREAENAYKLYNDERNFEQQADITDRVSTRDEVSIRLRNEQKDEDNQIKERIARLKTPTEKFAEAMILTGGDRDRSLSIVYADEFKKRAEQDFLEGPRTELTNAQVATEKGKPALQSAQIAALESLVGSRGINDRKTLIEIEKIKLLNSYIPQQMQDAHAVAAANVWKAENGGDSGVDDITPASMRSAINSELEVIGKAISALGTSRAPLDFDGRTLLIKRKNELLAKLKALNSGELSRPLKGSRPASMKGSVPSGKSPSKGRGKAPAPTLKITPKPKPLSSLLDELGL